MTNSLRHDFFCQSTAYQICSIFFIQTIFSVKVQHIKFAQYSLLKRSIFSVKVQHIKFAAYSLFKRWILSQSFYCHFKMPNNGQWTKSTRGATYYYQTNNPEKKRLEYEERKERLNAVLMERRAAKATNDTIESAPSNFGEKGDARLFWIGLFVAPLMLVIFFLTYYRICSSKWS